MRADVSDAQQVNATVSAVESRFGAVDILVNGAGGFQKFAPITEITDEEWDRVITNNMRTTFLCSRAVAKGMIERQRGRIISIASGAGIAPNPHAPSYLPYGAAKAGVIGFTKLLARDLGQYNITVNAIAPGTTLTPRVAKVRDAKSIEAIKSRNPMRALVEPIDTAEAALFLASPAGRYITGVTLAVNAGNLIV
jgi:3-oxoacyl-[acyl-carrier protein] reductase